MVTCCLKAIFVLLVCAYIDSTQPEHGYELIDMSTNRVWATAGYTDQEWENAQFPSNYHKVHPQNSMGVITAIHSPDASHDGEFIIKRMFNHTWNYAAKIIQNTTIIPNTNGLLQVTIIEKYQYVLYNSIMAILHDEIKDNYYLLETVDGYRNKTANIPLPDNWSIIYKILNDNEFIELSGVLSCVYDTLNDNFQGPLNDTIIKRLGFHN